MQRPVSPQGCRLRAQREAISSLCGVNNDSLFYSLDLNKSPNIAIIKLKISPGGKNELHCSGGKTG